MKGHEPVHRMTAPAEYVSTVDVIIPEEALKMEKCIVFTDTLMALLRTLHGNVCKRENCDHPLDYKKTYVWTCLVVMGMWFWPFWWAMAGTTFMRQDTSWEP